MASISSAQAKQAASQINHFATMAGISRSFALTLADERRMKRPTADTPVNIDEVPGLIGSAVERFSLVCDAVKEINNIGRAFDERHFSVGLGLLPLEIDYLNRLIGSQGALTNQNAQLLLTLYTHAHDEMVLPPWFVPFLSTIRVSGQRSRLSTEEEYLRASKTYRPILKEIEARREKNQTALETAEKVRDKDKILALEGEAQRIRNDLAVLAGRLTQKGIDVFPEQVMALLCGIDICARPQGGYFS